MVTMVSTRTVVSCIALLLLIILDHDTTGTALCMSLTPPPTFSPQRNLVVSRRRAYFDVMMTAAVASFCGIATTVVLVVAEPNAASAACLPGDLSKECIGIYKVPVPWDDQTDRKTIESFKKFAPELNYDTVPRLKRPKSNRVARQTLEQQQTIIQDTVINLVNAGRLEEAGICLLGVIPKVTSAGNFIVQESIMDKKNANANANSSEDDNRSSSSSNSNSNIAEIRLARLQSQYQLLLGLLGQSDVTIGQALRGDIPGTITMAVR